TSSSGSSRLMVGGAMRWCSASTAAIDSMAPAAPSRCPVMDLVADTAAVSAASPRAARIATASATSPCGVDVACAVTWTQSARVVECEPDRPDCAAPLRVGLGDVVAVGGDALPGHVGVHPGPACGRVLGRLEHEDARPLPEHEPVATLVVRP